MNIDHLSVSRSGVWKECRQKYKFRYHLKVPSPEPSPPYFTYGKLVHKIAEEFVRGKGEKNINDIRRQCLDGDILLEDLKEGEKPPIPPIEELSKAYISKLTRHLKAVLKFVDKWGFTGECELEFEYDLDPPNNRCVYGFIDRLIEKNGKYLIVDYKTTQKGPWRKNGRDVQYDPQLQCYTMVVSKKFEVDPKNIFAALLYVEGPNFVGSNFTQKTLDETRKRLLLTYKEIELSKADNVHAWTGPHCNRCDYASLCPFFNTNVRG